MKINKPQIFLPHMYFNRGQPLSSFRKRDLIILKRVFVINSLILLIYQFSHKIIT